MVSLSSPVEAHHGNPERLYVCKLVASAQMNSVYSGGNGTPEGGQFFGEFIEEFRFGETLRMRIHGDDIVGGFIEIYDEYFGKIEAPIITGKSYVALPYAPYGSDRLGSQFNTIAMLVRYEETFILNFYRSVLRFSMLGNSPTDNVDNIRHSFADCKYVGEDAN